ncbi:hypothetical protein NBRC116588_13250 [Pyruvatibacter sp. HU-CL02332]
MGVDIIAKVPRNLREFTHGSARQGIQPIATVVAHNGHWTISFDGCEFSFFDSQSLSAHPVTAIGDNFGDTLADRLRSGKAGAP